MQTIKNGSIFDEYLIIRLIAKGGMGEVYEAYERSLDRRVALKIVSPNANNAADMIRRFKREARILAKVNHSNIVTVYSIKTNNEMNYLAMELVDGVSIKDFLTEFSLPPHMALSLFMRSLEAVNVVHRLNIIHRDLKPGNILFLKDGEVKILDFGIAQFVGSNSDNGVVVGSPPYMAPELNDGFRASWSTECWSLGAILFELVTRQMIYHRLIEGHPEFSDGDRDMVPESILKIVGKACAKDPKARYESSEEMTKDLIQALKELPQATESDKLRLQAQVKELLNRARCMVNTQIAIPEYANTSLQVGAPMPHIPTGDEAFSASTIVVRRTTPQAQPTPKQKKSRPKWHYAVPAGALALGVGIYFVTMKTSLVSDSLQASSTLIDKVKSSDIFAAKEESKPEVKVETKAEAKPELKPETKPETKVVEAPKPEPANQPLLPVEDETIFAEGKQVEFKWSKFLKPKQHKLEVAADANFEKVLLHQFVVGSGYSWKNQVKPGSYFWRLKPANGKQGSGTPPQNFSVLDSKSISLAEPKAKSEFKVQGSDSATVDFKWACKFGIDHYQIEISPTLDFSKASTTSVENCNWSTQLPEGQYFWRVKSAKTVKNQDFSSPVLSFKVSKKPAPVKVVEAPAPAPVAKIRKVAAVPKAETAPPAPEKNLVKLLSPSKGAKAPTRNGQISIEFSWLAQPSVNKYVLELSTDPNFTEVIDRLESNDSKFLVEKLSQKGKIYWRVKPEGSGGSGEWSEASYLELL